MNPGLSDASSPYDSPTFGKDGSFEVNKPVGSMSISPCGRDVVLASRHGLHIIDLDDPYAPPRHLAHHTPWEVADVQWSPFPARDHWVVSTSNQKALVWNVEISSRLNPIEYTLHGHSRALTDIQFSAHHPDQLATCAVDSFVHCWDLRQPLRPALSFCDWFAGATQTKWNRLNPHIIASSHDRTLHIWDNRKGAIPLRSLDAHDTKIYGLDWNRQDPSKILTCSLDRSVKFWDYSLDVDRPERLLRTPFPVWRARHTPFGHGIVAMPQRGDFNLYLYDCREESIWDLDPDRAPRFIEKFTGHKNNVKEFLWRPRGSIEDGSDNREFQLVTWGLDQHLRLHGMRDEVLQETGFIRGKPGNPTTRRNAVYRTFRVEDSELPAITGQAAPSQRPRSTLGLSGTSALPAHEPLSKSTLTTALGWADTGFLNSQPGIRARGAPRKDIDPISWMKGVKIGKREDRKDGAGLLSPPVVSVDAEEQFANLAEEITHVGQTFSKVEFPTLEINKRFIRMSLSGPWGKGKSQAFLTCQIDYPTDYPKSASTLSLQETPDISDHNIDLMTATTTKIAQAFAQYKKYSTEAMIHYLQGERTLEEMLGRLKQGLETPDIGPLRPGEESSSDDEDDLNPLDAGQLEEFGLAGSDVMPTSNANDNVPRPKACAALWTNDGRLLCFFKPKDRLNSVAGSVGLDGAPGTTRKRFKFFDGFGRLQAAQAAKSQASSIGTADSDGSSSEMESDGSLSSSTSSSSLEDMLSERPNTAAQHLVQTSLVAQSISSKALDGMLGSETSRRLDMSYIMQPKSVISIHNLRHLLPTKRELASYQYRGVGMGVSNAKLAADLGVDGIQDAWQMVSSMIDSSQGKQFPQPSTTLGLPRELKRQDSGLGLDSNDADRRADLFIGTHVSIQPSLVGSVIARDSFLYFAGSADIQMAAALSCALQQVLLPHGGYSLHGGYSEPLEKTTETKKPMHNDDHATYGTRVGNMQFESANLQNASDPIKTARVNSDDLFMQPHSLASSLGADKPVHRSSFSTGNTPPTRRIPGAKLVNQLTPLHQLKPSPNRLWQLEHAANFIAGAGSFANALSQLSFSGSSSPPSKKWLSPTTSFHTARTNQNREGKSVPGDSENYDRRKSGAIDEFGEDRSPSRSPGLHAPQPAKGAFAVHYRNKSLGATPPDAALSPQDKAKLAWLLPAYRSAYAEFLTMWQLPIARAEVLKYNGGVQIHPSDALQSGLASESTTPYSTIRSNPTVVALDLGRRSSSSSAVATVAAAAAAATAGRTGSARLGLQRRCPRCGTTHWSERPTAPFRCLDQACGERVRPLACAFCSLPVRGRTHPCLGCGHVLHARCRARLAREPRLTSSSADGRCFTGGCRCTCATAVVVPVACGPDKDSGDHLALVASGGASSSFAGGKQAIVGGLLVSRDRRPSSVGTDGTDVTAEFAHSSAGGGGSGGGGGGGSGLAGLGTHRSSYGEEAVNDATNASRSTGINGGVGSSSTAATAIGGGGGLAIGEEMARESLARNLERKTRASSSSSTTAAAVAALASHSSSLRERAASADTRADAGPDPDRPSRTRSWKVKRGTIMDTLEEL